LIWKLYSEPSRFLKENHARDHHIRVYDLQAEKLLHHEKQEEANCEGGV
jgi:hypothetical protein